MSFTEVLAELAVYLRLDSSQFSTGSSRAAASAKKLEGSVGTLPKAFSGVTQALTGLAGSFAGGLLVGGAAELGNKLVELGKGAIEHAAALHAESQQLGVTTDDLQRYRFAASQVGLEQDKLDVGLKRLSKSIGLAANGAGPGAKAFAALGINVREANGHLKTAGEIVPEIAGALAKVPDPAARAALEFQLFGRSGQDMAPLLNKGAEGVRNLTAAADQAGVVISPELIERAHEAEIRFTKLKQIIETKVEVGLLTGLEKATSGFDVASQRVGAFDGWLQKIQQHADEWDRSHNVPTKSAFLGQFQTDPLKAFNDMLASITQRADEVDRKLGIPSPKAFLQSLIDGMSGGKRATQDWGDTVNAKIAEVADKFGRSIASIPAAVGAAWQRVEQSTAAMVSSVENWLKSRLSGAMDYVSNKARSVGDAFFHLYDRVVGHSYVPDMVEGIAGEFGRLQQVMVDPAVTASDRVAAAFQGLASIASQAFGPKVGGILNTVAKFAALLAPLLGGSGIGKPDFGGLFSVDLPAFSPASSAPSFTARANGGPVVPGKMYRIGENGPEYVSFGSAGMVTPGRAANDRGINVYQTIAPNFAGNAATRQDVIQMGILAKNGAIEAFRQERRRR